MDLAVNSEVSEDKRNKLSEELREKLRDFRISAGWTQKHAATALDWSPSKLLRMEIGTTSLAVPDVKSLLNLYGVEDEAVVAALIESARAIRPRQNSLAKGRPKRTPRRRPSAPRLTEKVSHYELLANVSDYTGAVLTAVLAIRDYAAVNNHEGVANAVDDLANLARRDGNALKRSLTTPSPSAGASGAGCSSPTDAT